MKQIQFMHGTETGTAEFLCEDLEAALGADWDCSISSLEDADVNALSAEKLLVIVSSTFGAGDPAGTAVEFHDALKNERPDLSHVRFAVFGLGDSTFETYNQGSEKLMTEMLACNAKLIGERGLFDAASTDLPEDVGVPWLKGILDKYSAG